jgi:hypothetical protein
MYPFVILGVITLVVFILLQTVNRNDMVNAGVSLFIGVILTYFIIYLRMGDRRRGDRDDKHRDRDRDENKDFLFWFNPNY